METATFAGGCFWCVQPAFEKLNGVSRVEAGYAHGTGPNPTYQDYAEKGYVEAVQITFDPSRITYPQLLDVFWRQIDPTDPGGQFADRGSEYRAAIFCHNAKQKRLAEKSRQNLAASDRYDDPIATEIVQATNFVKAEDYHQNFCSKDPAHYQRYRAGSGRDPYLESIWGKGGGHAAPQPGAAESRKPGTEELKERLTPLQYAVTQENATEQPFENEFWNNHREGIYVDIVSGEPLFTTKDQFDSGCGWPSFSKPVEGAKIQEKSDLTHGMTRTEVRSGRADSHLGHLFDDGPEPTGRRYCINSASLRFIPKEDLEKEGYGQFKKLFEK